MRMYDIIEKKRDGRELTDEELRDVSGGLVSYRKTPEWTDPY